MRIWSKLLIKFYFKWCIRLSRSLFFNSKYLGTWSHLWFAGVRECPPWCSTVGATVTAHQLFCIIHWRILLLKDHRVPGAHVAKFYGRFRLVRSVLRASQISVYKLTDIEIMWVITPSSLASACFGPFGTSRLEF